MNCKTLFTLSCLALVALSGCNDPDSIFYLPLIR